jgi:hypothetical protein
MGAVVRRSWVALVAVSALAGCSLLDAVSDNGAPAGAADGSTGHDDFGDASLPACALTDDFEDGFAAAMWDPFHDDDAQIREINGQLEISFTGVDQSWAGYQLAGPIDLTRGEVRIAVNAPGGAYTGIEVCFDDEELELFAEDTETLIGGVTGTPDSDDCDEIPFQPGVHRVWRIRTEAAIAYWEVSPDGGDWTLVHSQEIPFPLDAVTILVEAGGVSGDPAAAIESFAATPADCAE